MNTSEKLDILTKRDYLVVKGNELVQHSRFELSLPEQKTIAYICSLIKPIDALDRANNVPFQLEYEFNIRDYLTVCGLDYDNGKNYADMKDTLKKLSDRSMWLVRGNEEVLCRWLSKVWANKRSGKVKVRLDEDLVPYLFDLGEKFTQYQLYNILSMKSAFSVRIYELMKSYAFQKSKTFDIDELKRLLKLEDVKSYSQFAPFRQKVLDKAAEEINAYTDLNIRYETITKGRKVIKIKFYISLKSPIEHVLAENTASEKLKELC